MVPFTEIGNIVKNFTRVDTEFGIWIFSVMSNRDVRDEEFWDGDLAWETSAGEENQHHTCGWDWPGLGYKLEENSNTGCFSLNTKN